MSWWFMCLHVIVHVFTCHGSCVYMSWFMFLHVMAVHEFSMFWWFMIFCMSCFYMSWWFMFCYMSWWSMFFTRHGGQGFGWVGVGSGYRVGIGKIGIVCFSQFLAGMAKASLVAKFFFKCPPNRLLFIISCFLWNLPSMSMAVRFSRHYTLLGSAAL